VGFAKIMANFYSDEVTKDLDTSLLEFIFKQVKSAMIDDAKNVHSSVQDFINKRAKKTK
jgi:hypothetical protein